MPLEVAGPAAETRRELAGIDAAAAYAGARRHQRPLRAAFALDSAYHRRRAHLRRLQRLAQVFQLVLDREQARILRLFARLGPAVNRLRRRHRLGLRLGLRFGRLGLLHLRLWRRRRRRLQNEFHHFGRQRQRRRPLGHRDEGDQDPDRCEHDQEGARGLLEALLLTLGRRPGQVEYPVVCGERGHGSLLRPRPGRGARARARSPRARPCRIPPPCRWTGSSSGSCTGGPCPRAP